MITGAALTGIIVGAIALALFAAAFYCRHRNKTASEFAGWGEGAVFISIFGGLLAIWAVCMFIPYQADYLRYQTVSGTVERIEAMRLEERFALTLEGNPQPYKITDTRAALVEPGDTVTLECVKEFEWGSTNHGYSCKWGAQ